MPALCARMGARCCAANGVGTSRPCYRLSAGEPVRPMPGCTPRQCVSTGRPCGCVPIAVRPCHPVGGSATVAESSGAGRPTGNSAADAPQLICSLGRRTVRQGLQEPLQAARTCLPRVLATKRQETPRRAVNCGAGAERAADTRPPKKGAAVDKVTLIRARKKRQNLTPARGPGERPGSGAGEKIFGFFTCITPKHSVE
jgi:hypothetical protein